MSEDIVDAIVLLSSEDHLKIKTQASAKDANLPFYSPKDTKSLQFYLKHLHEKVLCSIDGSFDYSSIYELDFMNFANHPTIIYQMSS